MHWQLPTFKDATAVSVITDTAEGIILKNNLILSFKTKNQL